MNIDVGAGHWIAFLSFTIISCWTPGPNTLLCASHGARFSFKQTLPLIAGQGAGFFSLHIIVGLTLSQISEHITFFDKLMYVGAIYIIYLAYHIGKTPPLQQSGLDNKEDYLGFTTGAVLQLVNGKGWTHYLFLMITFTPKVGDDIAAVLLVSIISTTIGILSGLAWARGGHSLRRWMSDEKTSKAINSVFAAALVLVAIAIVIL